MLSILVACVAFASLVVLLYVMSLPRWLVHTASRLAPSILFEVPTSEKLLALTIDDSPSPLLTREILKVLKRHNCKATFFVIGSQAEQCPDVLEEMVADGHELANHTMVDAASFRLPLQELERQVDVCEELLAKYSRSKLPNPSHGLPALAPLPHSSSCGPPPPSSQQIKWFRPGHGWVTPGMLQLVKHKGYRLALGSVFGNDPWVKSPALLKWYYTYRAYPGAIMIIHDGLDPSRFQTVDVLDTVLPRLVQQGYRVTTVSDLYLSSHKAHLT